MKSAHQARSCGILVLLLLAVSLHNFFVLGSKFNRYQLHDRTVWASGQNARVGMKRYRRIPLVRWSKKAAMFVKDRWHAVQHRSTCERVMWMQPWHWGKTSQLRDWLDFAIVSVFTNNRTIIEAYGWNWYADYCKNGDWLTCYYEPFHGTQCNGTKKQGGKVANIMQFGGDRNFIQANNYCGRNTRDVHQAFPNAMWDQLVAEKQIIYYDPDTNVSMDRDAVNDLKQKDSVLYYSVSLSSLKSIIAKHILIPKKYIQQKADALTQGISNGKPVIAVHMRRTDKHGDHGASSGLQFSDRFILKAIGMICKQFFPPNPEKTNENCIEQLPSGINVLTLSDDTSAIVDLKRHLGHKFNVRTLSNISKLLHSDKERQEYKSKGHKYFEHGNSNTTFEYAASVFVDVVAASRADFLIGVGSSGVSQLVAQRIGGTKRADGNALSLWQEDLEHDIPSLNRRKSSIGCDKISWSKSEKYHGLEYDRASRKWTDKGAARCGPKRVWRGMGMSNTECKRDCEEHGLCQGILLNLDKEAYGTCWNCIVDLEACSHFRLLRNGTKNALCTQKNKGYLYDGYASDFEDCKQKCALNFECEVFNFWSPNKPSPRSKAWCQLHTECSVWQSDQNKFVATYERYNPGNPKRRK